MPTRYAFKAMFASIMDGHFAAFAADIQLLSSAVVSATVEVYERLAQVTKPLCY